MRFTQSEIELIGSDPRIPMELFAADDVTQNVFLHGQSSDLPAEELGGEVFEVLCGRMMATVNDPDNPGVGIAAPQVGIARNIVIVQRLDKDDEPFEVYVNPRIVQYSLDQRAVMEGCLSVPQHSGQVIRSEQILLEYLHPSTGEKVREVVEGYTAVIFQHEIDHLNGLLFTDRMEEQRVEIRYTPDVEGVCVDEITVVIAGGVVSVVDFRVKGEGGICGCCGGHLKSLSALTAGMTPEEVVDRLKGIECKDMGTSCADQLARAIELHYFES